MLTNLQFYAGLKTIGGTIVEVTHDRYRLLFDMGKVFDPEAVYERPIVPWVFADADDAKEESPYVTMIAISHHHADHTGLLPYIREEIPVVMSEATYSFMAWLAQCDLGDSRPTNAKPLAFQETLTWGAIKLTFYPVDHDIPGACAMLIETPDLRLVYTGDFRLHGLHPEWTWEFADAARCFAPDLLLIEGTRADSEDNRDVLKEEELTAFMHGLLLRQQGGAFFTTYPRNPERIAIFAEVARRTKRKLLLHPAHAYIYSNFLATMDDVYVWSPEYVSVNDQVMAWLETTGQKIITSAAIKADLSNWLIDLPFADFYLWDALGDVSGSIYFASNGSPLGPFDPSYAIFTKQLESRGVSLIYAGSTGHASRRDILEIASKIAPEVMMPLHSFKPWRIGATTIKRIMPEYEKSYDRNALKTATYPKATDLL